MILDVKTLNAEQYVNAVEYASRFIRHAVGKCEPNFKPEFALTLGSGLCDLAEQIEALATIPYKDLPYFSLPTVAGHKGEMVIGHLRGVPIIGLSGRKHYYEVGDQLNGMREVVFPVHVMANLGAKVYFATNAAGGLNQKFLVGDLMIIKDHIDLFMPDPLVGAHLDFVHNWYFQPQYTEYDPELRRIFQEAGIQSGEKEHIHEGIYTARTGRTYETAATSCALRRLGADAVGMSVIPEVIVATNRGLKTIAVSIVTNVIAEDGTNATSHEEVTAILNSKSTYKRLEKVFSKFFELYAQQYGFAAR